MNAHRRPDAGAQGPASAPRHAAEWLPSAALLVVAVAGNVCALLLIDAPPYAVYQHYRPWDALLAGEFPAVWGVMVQALVVAAAAWPLRHRLGGVLAGLPVRVWIVLLACGGFSLAVPTATVPRFAGEVLLAGLIAIVAALNLLLIGLVLPDQSVSRLRTWVAMRITLAPGIDGARAWDRRLPAAVGVWVMVAAAVVSWTVTERVPHIDDGVSNLFQAKYFASGLLTLPAPPDAEAFRVDQVLFESDRWYGYAFPGWPAVLALGVLAGVPWLVNPLLAGLLVVLAHAWIRLRVDRGTANATVLLLALSPWLIFMSAEFMGQPLSAVLVVLALLAFDRASRRERRWPAWAGVAGLAAGALMLTRPMDAVLTVAALGVTAAVDRRLHRAWPAVLIAGVLTAGLAGLMFPYSRAVTGRADYPPHLAWSDYRWGPGVDRLGFGPDVGIRAWPNLDPLPGHGPADVILNTNKNLFMTNVDLFGWAAGSLLLVWIAMGLARWRRADAPVLALVLMFVAGYNVYWFSGGPDLGARYWYPLVVPFAALSARGAQMLAERIRSPVSFSGGARVALVLALASLVAGSTMIPWRAATKHYRYRGVTGEIRALAAEHGFEGALVFVRSPNRRDYQSAFSLNPPTLERAGTIYAFDAGPPSRAAVVRRFGDRPVWVIGRSHPEPRGAASFFVIAGPLPPGTVPE